MNPFLDHLVLLVEDEMGARSEFESLGFRVVPGGVHAGGRTGNQLVVFEDGSYLELLGFRRRGALDEIRSLASSGRLADHCSTLDPMTARFTLKAAPGPGIMDLAIGLDRLAAALDRLRHAGWPIEGPVEGARRREDGTELRWEMGFPADPDLPFLLQDRTPRALRVPAATEGSHPNGITGIHSVTLAGPGVAAKVGWFRELEAATTVEGPDSVRLSLGSASILLRRSPPEPYHSPRPPPYAAPRPCEIVLRGAPGGVEPRLTLAFGPSPAGWRLVPEGSDVPAHGSGPAGPKQASSQPHSP